MCFWFSPVFFANKRKLNKLYNFNVISVCRLYVYCSISGFHLFSVFCFISPRSLLLLVRTFFFSYRLLSFHKLRFHCMQTNRINIFSCECHSQRVAISRSSEMIFSILRSFFVIFFYFHFRILCFIIIHISLSQC